MDDLQELKAMVNAILSKKSPTPDVIREDIGKIRGLFQDITDEQCEQLAVEFESIHSVTMNIGAKLEGKEKGFKKWLEQRKSSIEPYFWERYRDFLSEKDFSSQVLSTLYDVTDHILGLLGNPEREGKWDRRGMVVGHVQSGKTANYTGLICKAADAGYKLIIVIAGINNNLRNQTQIRIEEGFTGFHSSNIQNNRQGSENIIGVGKINSKERPISLTNRFRDFNKNMATSFNVRLDDVKQPVILVIKKNTNTLKNLLDWLKEHNARRGTESISSPMLMIDDEADNASINIMKDREKISRINGQIRQLLEVFDRSCYVGYTATPFANIFIDPDSDDEMVGEDLFPRDFIVSLDPPDNYFGPSQVFQSELEDESQGSVVRYITDNMDILPLKHQIDHDIVDLPESLVAAVRTFIVVRAIRLIRDKRDRHNSMLVNASRFIDVQKKLRNEIDNTVVRIKNSIQVNGAKPYNEALQDDEISALHEVFENEYMNNCDISWSDVQSELWNSISPIRVIEINSRSASSLDYMEYENSGLNVIAVGGFSLSRGLTLEGLTVSYFLRNSMMYDTLMQMGRWFGYRTGYDDLCRVWMLEEAEGWYAHISESIEELRDELRRMAAANATPKEFGLKVRSHPDTLIVTARNKMGSGERRKVSIGLANYFVETAILKRDTESLEENRRVAVMLAKAIRKADFVEESGEGISDGKLFKNVSASLVIDFISAFKNHIGSFFTETDPIIKYIENGINDELSNWDILFPGIGKKKNSKKQLIDNSLKFKLVCQRRMPGKRSDSNTLMITNKQRISSRGIEKVGLNREQIEIAEERYKNETDPSLKKGNLNYPDRIYRNMRQKPLLIIHMLAIGFKDDDLSNEKPVVGWSISFPRTDREQINTEYVVNTTWFNERDKYENYTDEGDDEGDDDDG